jgi:hypothetical protein
VNSNDRLRIYSQGPNGGIHEALYEGGWQDGNGGNTITTAKLGSPIAATTKDLNEAITPPSPAAVSFPTN